MEDDDYFFGETLTTANPTATWHPLPPREKKGIFKLAIRQFLLDRQAKEGEFNVVQVETARKGESIKKEIPVSILRLGEQRQATVKLEFLDPPVIFRLIEGSGPVHIHGSHKPSLLNQDLIAKLRQKPAPDFEKEEYEGDDDDDDDSGGPAPPGPPAKRGSDDKGAPPPPRAPLRLSKYSDISSASSAK